MRKKQRPQATHYSLMHEMMASKTEPLPEASRRYQLTRMWDGLSQIEISAKPHPEHLSVCVDAVNLMATLVAKGYIEDASGLLGDANQALAQATLRHQAGQAIRLSGPGIQAVRAVLEDYAMVKAALPARTMIHCHRAAERASLDMASSRRAANGVRVLAV